MRGGQGLSDPALLESKFDHRESVSFLPIATC
jgi:hypothetical protein